MVVLYSVIIFNVFDYCKEKEEKLLRKSKQETGRVCKIPAQRLTAFFRSRYFVFLVTGIPDRKAKMSLFACKSNTRILLRH